MNIFVACVAVAVSAFTGSVIGIYVGMQIMLTGVKKAFDEPNGAIDVAKMDMKKR